jgi:hypothetical protein
MDKIKANPLCMLVTKNTTINLKDHGVVLGISVEVYDTSLSDAKIKYNNGASIPIVAGGPARAFGGFYGNVPITYNGQLDIIFDTPGAAKKEVLLIITTLQC